MNKKPKRIGGLAPDIRQDSVVLILGTLPGPTSLSEMKYYSNTSNKFWDILFHACGVEFDKSDGAKDRLLKKYKIALWDILESAIRDTASDKDIKDGRPNGLPEFVAKYPNIKLLLFHSNDTYKYFRRFFKNTTIPYICVASPSAQNRKNIKEKALEWRAALSSVLPQLKVENKLEWK